MGDKTNLTVSLLGQKEDTICPIFCGSVWVRTQYQCDKNQVVRGYNGMYHVKTLNSAGLSVTPPGPLPLMEVTTFGFRCEMWLEQQQPIRTASGSAWITPLPTWTIIPFPRACRIGFGLGMNTRGTLRECWVSMANYSPHPCKPCHVAEVHKYRRRLDLNRGLKNS